MTITRHNLCTNPSFETSLAVSVANSFQGGTPGVGVTAGNSGGASGTAFDTLNVGAGSTIAYSMATPVAADSMSALITSAANVPTYVEWTTAFGTFPSETYGRCELELTGYPAAGLPIALIRISDAAAATVVGLNIDNNGHMITVRSSAGTTVSTGSTVIPLNQRVRIEWHFVTGSTTGAIEARLYLTASSRVVDETLSATGDTTGTPTRLRAGMCTARTTAPAGFRISKLAVAANDWVGPWAGTQATPLQPLPGLVFHGMSGLSPTDSSTATFETDANRGVAVVNWYDSWGTNYGTGFDSTTAAVIDGHGQINMITWMPSASGGVTQPTYALSTIIAGNHDAHITAWADGCKAFGKPIFLRFAHEMNGDWYSWCAGVNGNTAADYGAAWRHVWNIFAARGANNVTWVWCPNRTYPGSTSMSSLYPGSSYVDWMGIDAYNGGTDNGGTWKDVATTFDAAFTELRAVNSVKPVVIAEMGCSENGGTKSTWITDFFTALPTTYSYVKGVCWFNLDKTGTTSNWKIETSSGATTAYANGVANARYGTRAMSTFTSLIDILRWTAGGAHAPTLTQSTAQVWPGAGTHSMRITWATGNYAGLDGSTITFTTTAGVAYTASLWVFIPTGSPKMQLTATGGLGTSADTNVFNQWTRLALLFTASGTTTTIAARAAEPQTSGQIAYVDAVLFEQGTDLLPYFDGDTTGASWDGTAELSASTLPVYDVTPGMPSTVVEFDALPAQPTDFILGAASSTLGSAMVLTASPRWVAVTSEIQEVNIVRGRQSIDQPVQAGQATVQADNWSGNFDPDNANSAYTNPGGGLVKGMRCRVSALSAAGGVYTARNLFVGRLESVSLNKGYDLQSAILTFVDDLAAAGATSATSYNTAVRAESSGSRTAWLVSQLPNLTGVASVSASLTRQLLPTYGGGSILDLLNTVAIAEAGRCYADPFGCLTVTAHADESNQPTLATLSDSGNPDVIPYEVLTTGAGTMQVVSGSIVDRYNRNDSNYPSLYGGDGASADAFGGAVTAVVAPLADDSEAQALATYLGTRSSRPQPTIDSVRVNFAGQPAIGPLLAADLGDTLLVSRYVPYLDGGQALNLQESIEGITWSITTDSFAGTFYLAPTDSTSLFGGAGVFLIGTSMLDGADVLGAF